MTASSQKARKDLHSLRQDAARVVSDIGSLSKHIAQIGSEKTGEITDSLHENYEEQLAALRERLDSISGDLALHARKVDKHVHSNPYNYIFGALGLGLLLGKLLFPRSHN